MSELLNHEIAEYIVEYDPEYSDEVYQFAGLRIIGLDGEEISEFNIRKYELDEFELALFRDIQKKIQDSVGQYFYDEDVESFISELGLQADDVNIIIESI